MTAARTDPSERSDGLRPGADAFARGRLNEARTAYGRAVEDADRAGNARTLARAALGLGGIWVNERRAPDEYAEYREQLRTALRAVGRDEPELAARLRVRLAAEACYADGAALADLCGAVDAVRALDNPAATAE